MDQEKRVGSEMPTEMPGQMPSFAQDLVKCTSCGEEKRVPNEMSYTQAWYKATPGRSCYRCQDDYWAQQAKADVEKFGKPKPTYVPQAEGIRIQTERGYTSLCYEFLHKKSCRRGDKCFRQHGEDDTRE